MLKMQNITCSQVHKLLALYPGLPPTGYHLKNNFLWPSTDQFLRYKAKKIIVHLPEEVVVVSFAYARTPINNILMVCSMCIAHLC